MTDHDDDTPTAEADDTATVPATLLALQEVDTLADQLSHRRAHSALRDDLAARSEQLEQWERRRAALRTSIDTLGDAIASAEEHSAELLTHRQRLEQQLKTVIAPREAEALMHEITTIETERDELDTKELEALEQQASHDDELAAHLAVEESVRSATRQADEALAAEVADIDTELAGLSERRAELRATLAADLLSTYDRKRAALGVAVARLVGKQCQGCHMELSAAEIDTVREDAAATGVTDCPDCGRLLIA
ncbi:MAG: C4-type zinc ribbon domain-containing protein [Ilumatobacteraceae bacterium]